MYLLYLCELRIDYPTDIALIVATNIFILCGSNRDLLFQWYDGRAYQQDRKDK